MSEKKIIAADIQLDEHGRIVLDDDLLDSLSQHQLSPVLAGGSNASCANTGCSNNGCDSPTQTNSGCTNTGCGANLNSNCKNRLEMGGE
jgi:hypothetical protein